ncbi:MAG: MFS transporter [Deltaproteobacteria bacterium]|nr:MFS transporter [Deltaproteobacteria bacterium]
MSTVALGASIVVPLLPVYATQMGATGYQLGLIFSAFALARTILLPAIGHLSDTYGRRIFMLIGLTIYSMIAVAFALAETVNQLIIFRLIQGAGAAMVIPIAKAYAGDMASPGQEGQTMAHFNMAFFGGLACGPWIGGYIKDFFGIDIAFYSMSGLALLAFLLSWFSLPRLNAGSTPEKNDRKMPYLAMIRNPSISAMLIFRFGSIIGLGMNWTFLPLYGHTKLGLSGGRIGILVSLTVLMTTLLQPIFGRMADRLSRVWMTFHGGLWASICLLGVPFCARFRQLFILNLLIGTAIGLYMPPLMAMAVDTGRKYDIMNRLMSLLEMAFSVGMVIGPIMAGLVADASGLRTIFWVGGTIGIMASIGFLTTFLIMERTAEGG